MAYDDSGSLANHERIKHGMTYNQAAKKGLVPPIVRENNPLHRATKASMALPDAGTLVNEKFPQKNEAAG